MIEAAAQRTHVSSFRCGSRMVRNPRRHACICIEACSGGFWGILRQGIRRVSFGKHVLALGFDGIQLFQRELAYRVKPTRGCKAIISGKLSVGPRTSQSYRRRVCSLRLNFCFRPKAAVHVGHFFPDRGTTPTA